MLDKELHPQDIQSLSSADRIHSFFSYLGYNTLARVEQTPANLGITPDNIARKIKRVELLADQEGLFHVYLFELDSVTVATTRALARAFRNRAGNYLLALTSDYDHIDFVLVEKYVPLGPAATAIGQKQVGVRPRSLTVERLKPERVHLHVLRRFTYTEADPYAQYDKLLSAYSVADWSEKHFNNRALFSDYYLMERLRDHPAWREDPKPAFARFQTLYERAAAQWGGKREGELREGLFKPVFEALGFKYEVVDNSRRGTARRAPTDNIAPKSELPGAPIEPDFLLYSPANGAKPVALCLTYPWGRTLDGKDTTQRDAETPDENPGQTVVSLLEKPDTDWVIVTNGKHWRLYCAKAHSKATNYYEIDLEEVLADIDDPADSFRYFWLLFRREAFESLPPLPLLPDRDKSPLEIVPVGATHPAEPAIRPDSAGTTRGPDSVGVNPHPDSVGATRRVARAETTAQKGATATPPPKTFLNLLLRSSEDYAKRLGSRLKERVFEKIFPHFAEGFIEYIRWRDGLNADLSQPALDRIFQGTLTFLYRLLFLLYAESRDLLPAKETRGYYEKSLTKLKKEIAEAAGRNLEEAPTELEKEYRLYPTIGRTGMARQNNCSDTPPYDGCRGTARRALTWESQLDDNCALYDRLVGLFRIIDQGDSNINVPPYNGGLFLTDVAADDDSPEAVNARFLSENKIPDLFLARGLDLLARDEDEKTFELVAIDYKSLGVRQLGSIYEGLLEFKLRVASEKMAVCKGKKTEEVVPYREAKSKNLKILTAGRGKEAKERIYKLGDVYLENDRRERKATGSYYTPDYIVKYIVENTVGPVLNEKFDAVTPKLREAQKAFRDAIKRRAAFDKKGMSGDDPEKVANTYEHVVKELFDVKVLDPAMGSGHFLVEAVDFITDKMLDFLNGFPWNPVVSQLNSMRETILHEMEDRSITIDKQRLTDVNLLKRHVLKRCIYGVDLNPMAVELAKVSLWLDCFTLGAPLSFLDHHLKCGNSVIGAESIEEHILPRTDRREAFVRAVGDMLQIMNLADVTSTEVRSSQNLYRDAKILLDPTRTRLNVQVSRHFQDFESENELHHAWAFAHEGKRGDQESDNVDLRAGSRKKFLKAQEIANDTRFFHWELEFPEVFYGVREGTERVFARKENPGFEAVIGNPPYVRQEALGELKPYLKAAFPKVYNGVADIYVYFYGRGLTILRKGGRFGMITSNKFMRSNYGKQLRKFLTDDHSLCEMIDFGELPVFEDASTFPIIVLCSAGAGGSASPKYTQVKALPVESLPELVADTSSLLPRSAVSGESWSLAQTGGQTIIDKTRSVSMPLGKYCNGQIKYGIKTGFNEAFIIDRITRDRLIAENPKSAEIIKPLIVGDDVRRYEMNFSERYLIWTYIGVPIKKYPAIFAHLKRFQKQLEQRWDKGEHWWDLRACDYYADFEKPKILWPDIAISSRYSFDRIGLFLTNTGYMLPHDDAFLLAVLNSRILEHCFKSFAAVLGDPQKRGRSRHFSQYTEQLPIRRIHSTTPESERKRLVSQLKAYHNQEGGCSELLKLTEILLPKDSDGKFLAFKPAATGAEEKSDVVHDFLAYLAEQMLELNKKKQAEMKRFFGWLEQELRIAPDRDSLPQSSVEATRGPDSVRATRRVAPTKDDATGQKENVIGHAHSEGKGGIQALTGKTAILNYLGDYQKGEDPLPFKSLLDVLHKNKSRLGVSLADTKFTARLEKEYESSLEKLLPTKSELSRTDHLIDQIVYRLYGLTEEEIAIVEGKK